MSSRYTAARTSLRTASILTIFTLAFTALMAVTYSATRPAIEASAIEEKMRLINEVLPATSYDNVLLDDIDDRACDDPPCAYTASVTLPAAPCEPERRGSPEP